MPTSRKKNSSDGVKFASNKKIHNIQTHRCRGAAAGVEGSKGQKYCFVHARPLPPTPQRAHRHSKKSLGESPQYSDAFTAWHMVFVRGGGHSERVPRHRAVGGRARIRESNAAVVGYRSVLLASWVQPSMLASSSTHAAALPCATSHVERQLVHAMRWV